MVIYLSSLNNGWDLHDAVLVSTSFIFFSTQTINHIVTNFFRFLFGSLIIMDLAQVLNLTLFFPLAFLGASLSTIQPTHCSVLCYSQPQSAEHNFHPMIRKCSPIKSTSAPNILCYNLWALGATSCIPNATRPFAPIQTAATDVFSLWE